MAENQDETNAFVGNADMPPLLSGQVLTLGYGYRGRRTWARRPNLSAPAAPLAGYRRPVPCKDDDDDMPLEAQGANETSHQQQLEAGSREAAHGPPEDGDGADDNGRGEGAQLEAGLWEAVHGPLENGDGGDDNGRGEGDGGDGNSAGDDDDMYTARSSPIPNCSLDSEAALAFARDWEDKEGVGAGDKDDHKLFSSSDPALFQEEREAARSMLAAGAFYTCAAKAMVEQHQRARKEADEYLEEVNLAMQTLPNLNIAVHITPIPLFRVSSGWTGRGAPSAAPRSSGPNCGPCTRHAARNSAV